MSELEGASQFFAQRSASPTITPIERPQLPEPAVRRWLTLLCMEVVTAAAILSNVVDYGRLQVLRDYVDGSASFADVEHGDDIAALFLVARIALGVLGALLLALWTFRTVKNAGVRYPSHPPGPISGALSWFVPVIWFFVPWSRLRWASRVGGAPDVGTLSVWQTLFVLNSFATFYAYRWAPEIDAASLDGIVGEFQRHLIIASINSVMLLACVFCAWVAMPQIDRQTSGTEQ